jgi:hypothetical protein
MFFSWKNLSLLPRGKVSFVFLLKKGNKKAKKERKKKQTNKETNKERKKERKKDYERLWKRAWNGQTKVECLMVNKETERRRK